ALAGDEPRRARGPLGRDVVGRAALVVRPPAPPFLHLLEGAVHPGGGHGRGDRCLLRERDPSPPHPRARRKTASAASATRVAPNRARPRRNEAGSKRKATSWRPASSQTPRKIASVRTISAS